MATFEHLTSMVEKATDFKVVAGFVRSWVSDTVGLWTPPGGVSVGGSDGIVALTDAELELGVLERLRAPLRPACASLGSVRVAPAAREVSVDGALIVLATPEDAPTASAARAARRALVGALADALGNEGDSAGVACLLALRGWTPRAVSETPRLLGLWRSRLSGRHAADKGRFLRQF